MGRSVVCVSPDRVPLTAVPREQSSRDRFTRCRSVDGVVGSFGTRADGSGVVSCVHLHRLLRLVDYDGFGFKKSPQQSRHEERQAPPSRRLRRVSPLGRSTRMAVAFRRGAVERTSRYRMFDANGNSSWPVRNVVTSASTVRRASQKPCLEYSRDREQCRLSDPEPLTQSDRSEDGGAVVRVPDSTGYGVPQPMESVERRDRWTWW